MADYLTRLASRTLGLTPVAEPVVAPLFAPDEPATTVSDPGGFGEEIQVQSDPGIVPVRHPKSSATSQKKDDLPVAPPSFAEGGSKPAAGPPLQDSRSEGTPEERLAPPLPALLAQRKPPAGSVRAVGGKNDRTGNRPFRRSRRPFRRRSRQPAQRRPPCRTGRGRRSTPQCPSPCPERSRKRLPTWRSWCSRSRRSRQPCPTDQDRFSPVPWWRFRSRRR